MVLAFHRDAHRVESDAEYLWNSDSDDESITAVPTSSPSYPSNMQLPGSQLGSIAASPTGDFDLTSHPTPHSPYPLGTSVANPSTLETAVVSSLDASLYSQNGQASTAPTAFKSGVRPASPTSTKADDSGSPLVSPQRKGSSNHVGMYAAAGAVPVIVGIIGLLLFFYIRKRKRQQRQHVTAPAAVKEMKTRDLPYTQPQFGAPPPSPPAPAQLSVHSLTPPSTAIPTSPPPVILGPITAGGHAGTYYTGIDTSDVVSVNDHTGLGNPFADNDSLSEEPPPPYKPRSVPPLSRDSSQRSAAAMQSTTNLIQPTERSPFADPEDDSVSIISGPVRNRDDMSDVSDLSYQQDPVVTRPAV